jgi:integrase
LGRTTKSNFERVFAIQLSVLKGGTSFNNMLKRDPYKHKERWLKWKADNKNKIKGVSDYNSNLILTFLFDMEIGKNSSPKSKKGERSFIRLNNLKDKMLFFADKFDKDLDKISKDEIHMFFSNMRNGIILRKDGKQYTATGEFVRDFKAFWNWLRRTGRVDKDITEDLRRSDSRKPPWTYLTEEEFKILANKANSDYRALIWLMYDSGMRVTEAYSIRIKDFSKDFTQLAIRDEYSKTFGRTIKLKLCSGLIKELVDIHNLGPDDFIFIKKPSAFNKYLRTNSEKLFGTGETPGRAAYSRMTLYDIRHNSSCYWLKRYPNRTGLMYRMGWSRETMVMYYSEFLGLADQIDDENMVTTEDKNAYVKEIEYLKKKEQKTSEMMEELLTRIKELESEVRNSKYITEPLSVYSADH